MSKRQRDATEDELAHAQFICCNKSLHALHKKWSEDGYEADIVMTACSESSARICIHLGVEKEGYLKAMGGVFDDVKLHIEKHREDN
jgi:hypothetical protein